MLINQFLTISLHPLLTALCFFILGIYLQSENYHYALFIFIAISLAIPYFVQKKLYSLRPLFYVLVFFAGTYIYDYQCHCHYQFFTKIDNQQHYALTGIIDKIENLQFKRYSSYCILKNAALYKNSSNAIIQKNFCIGIYSNNLKNCCIGDTISLQNILFKKQNSQSYQQYLIKEGLVATLFLPNNCEPFLISRPKCSIKRWINNKKIELFNSLKNKMPTQCFTFFSSLFLGAKINSFLYDTIKERFKYWGLSHYLARSGLHLILFIALWQLLLRGIPVAYITKHLILSLLVMFYFMFSWPSLPFTRSCITYFAYFLYSILDKQIDSLHILTLVTWLILITNPMQLFSLDFQLSFGLTFALIWFSRIQNKKREEAY